MGTWCWLSQVDGELSILFRCVGLLFLWVVLYLESCELFWIVVFVGSLFRSIWCRMSSVSCEQLDKERLWLLVDMIIENQRMTSTNRGMISSDPNSVPVLNSTKCILYWDLEEIFFRSQFSAKHNTCTARYWGGGINQISTCIPILNSLHRYFSVSIISCIVITIGPINWPNLWRTLVTADNRIETLSHAEYSGQDSWGGQEWE